MKIYTKNGDSGKTALIGGKPVSKNNIRIEAYGGVDELNAWIGLIGDLILEDENVSFLRHIQNQLFVIGAKLATPLNSSFKAPDFPENLIDKLESEIDKMDAILSPLTNFILPGGHMLISHCHIARVVCRRVERNIVSLSESEPVEHLILVFMNRLSDYLFILARYFSKKLEVDEIVWKANENKF
jgi:cob(I)alamin adenosyltransferase